jgi:hypothetical protein
MIALIILALCLFIAALALYIPAAIAGALVAWLIRFFMEENR